MRANVRGAPPACLAGVSVALERGSADVLHARLMDRVKHHVQAHPETECSQRPRAAPEAQYAEHGERRVEGSGGPRLGSVRPVVEAHRLRRADAPLLKAEREVVI